MDFTSELLAFQGVLTSADNIHAFSTLITRGGNGDKINRITDSVIKYLKDSNYINDDGRIMKDKEMWMRKFAFYIILNADLPTLADMVEMDGVEAVIWTVPTITKCLMCELCWKLHMEQFIYEIISYCYPQFAMEVLECFLNSIKYLTPEECVSKIKILAASCYKLICRLHFFNLPTNLLCDQLITGYDHFQMIVNNFPNPPNIEQLNTMSKLKRYKYMGDCLYTMAQLLLECLDLFTSKLESEPIDFNELYKLTFKNDFSVKGTLDFHTCNTPEVAILEFLNKCNTTLLDRFQDLVMDVSVEVFCAWSEFEENGKSMQEKIGNICYKLREKLLTISSVVEHPVVIMLQQISRKPTAINQAINNTDTDKIIENIGNNDEDKTRWINALIYRENLCEDLVLITALQSNLKHLNEESSFRLYKILYNQIICNPDCIHYEYIHMLAVNVFKNLSDIMKYEILDNSFSNNCFVDMKETVYFDTMITEVFNKLISAPDSDLDDILTVFIQSPQKVYTKIINVAIENSKQTIIMLRVMNLLEKYSNHYYNSDTEPCIIRTAQTMLQTDLNSEAKNDNLVTFLHGLKISNIITGVKLLLLIIMPNLHKALQNKDINKINIQIKLLTVSYGVEELLTYRAPMLAMLAQVLHMVRWKLPTFTPLSPATLQMTLDLQKILFNTYESVIPEKELLWLKSRLRNLEPLNMYYYRKLWTPPGGNFIEVVSGTRVHSGMDIGQLTTWLSQVLCSSTQQEYCDIWESLSPFDDTKTLDILHNAISLMTAVEARNRSENTWGCLLHCYRNYIYLIRYIFFKTSPTGAQVTQVLNKIANLSNLIEDEKIHEIGTVFLPLTAYIVETKDIHKVDLAECLQGNSRNPKFIDIINQVFSNGVS